MKKKVLVSLLISFRLLEKKNDFKFPSCSKFIARPCALCTQQMYYNDARGTLIDPARFRRERKKTARILLSFDRDLLLTLSLRV